MSCDGTGKYAAGAPCCLSVAGGSTSGGTPLNLYKRCTNGPPCVNQQFSFPNGFNATAGPLVAKDGLCIEAGAKIAPSPPPPGPVVPPPPPFQGTPMECAMRKLAFERANLSLPLATDREIQQLYSSLTGDGSCHGVLPTPRARPSVVEHDTWPADFSVKEVASPGNLSQALATLRYRRALDGSAAPAVLLLRGGVYELSAPIRFGPDDRGMSIRSYPGESATLSAGRTLSLKFTRESSVGAGVDRYVASLPPGLVQATSTSMGSASSGRGTPTATPKSGQLMGIMRGHLPQVQCPKPGRNRTS